MALLLQLLLIRTLSQVLRVSCEFLGPHESSSNRTHISSLVQIGSQNIYNTISLIYSNSMLHDSTGPMLSPPRGDFLLAYFERVKVLLQYGQDVAPGDAHSKHRTVEENSRFR